MKLEHYYLGYSPNAELKPYKGTLLDAALASYNPQLADSEKWLYIDGIAFGFYHTGLWVKEETYSGGTMRVNFPDRMNVWVCSACDSPLKFYFEFTRTSRTTKRGASVSTSDKLSVRQIPQEEIDRLMLGAQLAYDDNKFRLKKVVAKVEYIFTKLPQEEQHDAYGRRLYTQKERVMDFLASSITRTPDKFQSEWVDKIMVWMEQDEKILLQKLTASDVTTEMIYAGSR